MFAGTYFFKNDISLLFNKKIEYEKNDRNFIVGYRFKPVWTNFYDVFKMSSQNHIHETESSIRMLKSHSSPDQIVSILIQWKSQLLK